MARYHLRMSPPSFDRWLPVVLLLAALASTPAVACDVPPGVAENRVVPLVRSRAFVERTREHNGQVLPVRWVNSELAVVYAENTLVQLKYFRVPPEQAACWEKHAALQDALSNLSREIKAMEVIESRPGVLMVTLGGNFESSMILAPRVLRKAVEGRFDPLLVGVPNRDMLLVADPQDAEARRALRQVVADSFSKGSNPISDKLFLVSSCDIAVVADDAVPPSKPCH